MAREIAFGEAREVAGSGGAIPTAR